jgi:hypothetical protein
MHPYVKWTRRPTNAVEWEIHHNQHEIDSTGAYEVDDSDTRRKEEAKRHELEGKSINNVEADMKGLEMRLLSLERRS